MKKIVNFCGGNKRNLSRKIFQRNIVCLWGGGASVRRLFNALIYYSVALRIRGDNSRGGL